MKNETFRKFLPYVIALTILVVLGSMFFFPALRGYKLRMGDMRAAAGMSQEVRFYHETTGEYSAWTNSMFSGMPVFQIYNFVDFDGNVLHLLTVFLTNVIPQPASLWLLYALSFFILMRVLRVNLWLSLVGAVGFAFSTYFIIIIEAGHITKAIAIGIAPALFAGLILLYQGRYLLGLAITSLVCAMEIGANHVQVTYYFGMLFVFFGLFQLILAIKEKNYLHFFKATSLALVAAVIGVLCNFSNLFNTYEYGKETTRGKTELTINPDSTSNAGIVTEGLPRDYVTDWSYGLQESWTLLIPDAKGGGTAAIGDHKALASVDPQVRQNIAQSNRYWGDQDRGTSGPVYVGAGIFLLFVLGLVFLRDPIKWPLFAGAVLALMLSWGRNFMGLTDFFLDHIPGYNKFRSVTIILVIVEFCIPVIGFLFVNYLIEKREELVLHKKKILYVGLGLLGLLLAFWMVPDVFFNFISSSEKTGLSEQAAKQPEMASAIQVYIEELKKVRIAIFKGDVLRSLFFASATFGLIYAFLNKNIKVSILIAGVGLITLMDLFSVNRRYINTKKENGRYLQWEEVKENKFPYMPDQADMEIFQRELAANPSLRDTIDKRIAERKAKKLAEGAPGMLEDSEQASIQFGVLNSATNYRVLNLTVSTFNDASTSYFHKSVGGYHAAKLKRYHELIAFHFSRGLNPEVLNMLNTKYIITQNGVQVNPAAYGNAWFVKDVKFVKNADEEILALNNTNLKDVAVVDKRFSKMINHTGSDSTATIKLIGTKPNKLVYESSSSKEQVAVFSEIYYPDWKCFIDGKEAKIVRADYVLRAVTIPAGNHKIEFVFDPEEIIIGKNVSLAGSGMVMLLLIVTAWSYIRRGRDKQGEQLIAEKNN